MKSDTIRTTFLDFFVVRGHRLARSSSLVPLNDPTLLFSNAGMNQFKDVFLGRERRAYSRACSSQKCVRAGGKHNDLEQVGRTARHHTFFEMLGNFSFGDYFKKDAIPWAWELVTQVYSLPIEKLYVTIFREDDEAEEIWASGAGVDRRRIFRMDEKDNFWAMGDTGPCGPCSEIHYDMGPEASDVFHQDCKFPCDCGRYVELWNLVFMQFNRDEQGNLAPLPRPSIDTGAGLERLAAVLQGKLSNFDTDLFRPLIQEAAELANVEYGARAETDISLRILADHSRAAAFLISDGVVPSNEGRGYVLRLIMRRALYHGQTLGLQEPFLYKMSGHVIELMKSAYPELVESAPHVAKSIKVEEERFAHTTRVGLERLDEAQVMLASGKTLPFGEYKSLPRQAFAGNPGSLRGEDLFKLHDTFGLRPDFVQDVVKDYGLSLDWDGYNAEMQRQRERARASWKGAEKKAPSPAYLAIAEKRPTRFDGYSQTESAECRVLSLLSNGETVERASPGATVEVVLDHTPFYAEAGGQIGDTGRLDSDSGEELAQVTDTQRPVAGVIAHKVAVLEPIETGMFVTARVDIERRDAIRRNHTATHLLHAALRATLGTHVKQAGSLVAPERLRFDFTHYAPLDEQDRLDIEDLVNRHILANEEMHTHVLDLDAAINSGAMALFGEKYGDKVRVVSVADGSFSKELCGGTHVRRTGDIGLFKLISEASVSAGARRIEAITGTGVLDALRRETGIVARLSEILRARPDEALSAAEKLSDEEKRLRKQLETQRLKRAVSSAADLIAGAREVKGVRVVSARVEAPDRAAMRQLVDNLRPKLGAGVIVLGSSDDGKVALVAAVSKDLTARLDAGKIIKAVASIVEGAGGGRKDLAEAGGKNPARLDEAIQSIPKVVEAML
ncbi:MAG TPA: alanine--tRNA ligase [Terriglobia bacterium]|nr:alanine--tRNA ligase [Terriglobia bacterium]